MNKQTDAYDLKKEQEFCISIYVYWHISCQIKILYQSFSADKIDHDITIWLSFASDEHISIEN
jgi:hypothetical protein